MIAASQLRPGMAIRYEGQAYRVLDAEYHPGQGRAGGQTHSRLQNVATGTLWEHSFRSELKLEEISMEKRPLEFLYLDGGLCCFMDPETFEQTEIPQSAAGPRVAFLEPGMKLSVEFVEGRAVNIAFPDFLEVAIADTAPSAHQQVDSAYKTAKLGNGIEVMVPQFVKTGDVIRLDLETLKYMDRVKTDAKGRSA